MSSSGTLTGCQGCEAYRPAPIYSDGGLRFSSFYVAETDSNRPAYFSSLLKSLTRKGKSREDAEDLVQEAMLRLHVYAKSNAVLREEAFLRRVLHNLAIDQYRHNRSGILQELPLQDVDQLTPLIDLGATPDQTLEGQQRLDEIAALLNAVNPRTREIYFAHQSGYSRAEIADEMGIAKITVNRHMARALAVLLKVSDQILTDSVERRTVRG
jgi:RNA polymerase sigma factor (sigma-70 family)